MAENTLPLQDEETVELYSRMKNVDTVDQDQTAQNVADNIL